MGNNIDQNSKIASLFPFLGVISCMDVSSKRTIWLSPIQLLTDELLLSIMWAKKMFWFLGESLKFWKLYLSFVFNLYPIISNF